MVPVEVDLKEETCNEYEFGTYSLIHVLNTDMWELHFYDEDEGELFTYIKLTSFDEELELLDKLGFTKEMFEKLIQFEENRDNA